MDLVLDDVALGDIERCAEIACASEIGLRYGFELASLAARMREALLSGAIIVAAREAISPGLRGADKAAAGIVGFAWVDPKGAFGASPYLKLIAVDQWRRGSGAGAALLAEYERRTAGIGRAWTLMVSDFNEGAIKFYEAHGYHKAGSLEGFAREGITELLMVKKKT